VCGLDSTGSGRGPVAVYFERDNEPPGCVKDGKFLDLVPYKFSKKGPVP
jgi:hypothetical protein